MERLFEQHTRVNEKLHQWVSEKEAYLNVKEDCDTVGKSQVFFLFLEF